MNNENDIRWKQRFSNYESAYLLLKDAIEEFGHTTNNLIKEGIIHRFKFTHELAWKVMKDYLTYEGLFNITGSRYATREAFAKELISNGGEWMNMLETRNLTVHTYDESILRTQFLKITDNYLPLFEEFYLQFKSKL